MCACVSCRSYSVQVADTVLVVADKAPEVLTRFSNAKWDAVSYDISDEPEEDDDGGDSDLDVTASRCAFLGCCPDKRSVFGGLFSFALHRPLCCCPGVLFKWHEDRVDWRHKEVV